MQLLHLLSWFIFLLAAVISAANELFYISLVFAGCSLLFGYSFYRRIGILYLGGFSWSQEDFCRGWLITGTTGSGKTVSAINNMLNQITKNCPNWGGLCIDEKGLFWESLQKIFKKNGRADDLILLQVRPDFSSETWKPTHTFNFLGLPQISLSAKAKIIGDVACAMNFSNKNDSFFVTQAITNIEYGLRLLTLRNKIKGNCPAALSLEECRELLCDSTKMDSELIDMTNMVRNRPEFQNESELITKHLKDNFRQQPPEQLGGVKGVINNMLSIWKDPYIQQVFCGKSTFSFNEIDKGKVICVSMPQKFLAERRYINTLLKYYFFQHALQRFDKPKAQRKNDNLLILWADEAQQILSNEGAMSDYNVVDRLREAKATMVAATQSFKSIIPSLSKEKADVFLANMANRITFKAADEESARVISESIGKNRIKRKDGSSIEEYKIPPEKIRNLKKFRAVIQHCEKGFKTKRIKPRFL